MAPDQIAAAFEDAALGELLGVVVLVVSLLALYLWAEWTASRSTRKAETIAEGYSPSEHGLWR